VKFPFFYYLAVNKRIDLHGFLANFDWNKPHVHSRWDQTVKQESTASGKHEGRIPDADDIKIDKDFAALIPALSKDEYAQLEHSVLTVGCRDPLIVWKGKDILLDGHNRLSICRRHNIPFKVESIEFLDREGAEAFIVENQLGRRNLSPEAASYLRGKRYLSEKQTHGGDRRKEKATDQSDRMETARRLADEFKVGEATVRRDGGFAKAVDAIAVTCGAKAKQAILARDAGLSRGAVVRLARMKPKEQQKFIQELLQTGKRLRRPVGRKPSSFTLPAEPKSLAQKLIEKMGVKGSSEVLEALTELLKAQKSKS